MRNAMLQLEAFLRSIASPAVRFFAEVVDVTAERLEDLQNELRDTTKRADEIQAKADKSKRALTPEEAESIDTLYTRFNAIELEITRRNNQIDMQARLNKPMGRKTQPDDGRGKPLNRPAIEVNDRFTKDKEKWGWESFGAYAKAVKTAHSRGSLPIDPRLIYNVDSNITAGSEEPGADGGFAIPPDFRREIMVKVVGEESLIGRTDQYTSESNGISFPTDESTPWGVTGIQAYWTGEGQQKTQSKPNVGLFEVKLHKLAALVPMTDELLEDAAAMSTYLRRKTPEVIAFKVNDAIINGIGDSSGMPFGILESSARVTVDPDGSSAGNAIVMQDIVNMYSRMYAPCRRNSVWLINQSLEPALWMMSFPGTGTAVPVYLPAGGLSASPFATLMGRPVIPIESAQEVGTEGDIILADLTRYVTVQKTSGLRQDVSIHLFFDYDITAFRFVLRIGGKPWWTSPVTGNPGSETSAGGITRSCFVTLGDRS